MTGRSRRAVALAVAAALLAPPRSSGGEPVAAGPRLVLCLSDLPQDESWLAGLDAGLEGRVVVHRALPDGDERLLEKLLDSFSPAAVVSRRPLADAARRVVEARGLPVLEPPLAAGAAAPGRTDAASLRELARTHLEFGDDRAAERALERLLAGSPGDPEALRSLLSLWRRELRFWPAIDAAERLAAVPGLPPAGRAEALLSSAELRALVGDTAGAARAYESVLASSPGDPAALTGLAQARRDRPKEALRHAALAAAGPGATPAALRLLAEIHLDLGDFPAARRALERALTAAPGDLEALALMVSAEKGRPARASAWAEKAAAVAGAQPVWRRPDAYRLSARLRRELGDLDRADALYRRAVAIDPDHLETLRDLLSLRQERPGGREFSAVTPWASDDSDPERPEAELLRALATDAADLDALLKLIEARIAQGRLKESAALTKLFLSAVGKAPSWMRASAYRAISRIAWDSGDPAPAWFSAKASDPGEPWALTAVRLRLRPPGGSLGYRSSEVEVAAARARLGDPEGAERRLKRVLDAFPEDRHALEELFRLTAESGRREAALALAGRLEQASAGSSAQARASTLAAKAQAQLELGDPAGAEKSLLQALSLSDDALSSSRLVELLVSQRRFAEALPYAERLEKASATAQPRERAEACVRKARIQLELKDAAASEPCLREALRLDPEGPALPLLLQAAVSQRRFPEALSLAEKLEKTGAAAPPARRAADYYHKARIQLELKDEAGAEKSLGRSLSLFADGPALVSMLHLTMSQRRFAEALSYAERLERQSGKAAPPERAAILVLKAQIQMELKDDAGAEKTLEQALRLQPDGPALPMLRHLAENRRRPAEASDGRAR